MNMEPVTLTRTLKVIPSEQKSLRHVEFDPGLNTERIDISYHFTPDGEIAGTHWRKVNGCSTRF